MSDAPTPAELAESEPQQIAVAVVVYRSRILVGVRPLNVPLGGYAEFPGGKVQEHESHQEAAERECFEETGMRVKAEKLLDIAWKHYEHADVEVHFFQCRLITRNEPRLPYHWVPIDRLTTYKFPPANATVLAKLRKMEPG